MYGEPINNKEKGKEKESENPTNVSHNSYKPRGMRGVTNGIKNVFGNFFGGIKQATKQGMKNIWTLVFKMILRKILLVVLVIVIIACFVFVLDEETAETSSSTVSSYMTDTNNTKVSTEEKQTYENTGSLVLVKDENMKEMSNSILENLEKQNSILYEPLSKEGYIGTHKISEIEYANGFNIANGSEFILYADKLNFNRINWQKYTKIKDANGNVIGFESQDIQNGQVGVTDGLVRDEKTNLIYPYTKEQTKELTYFTSLTAPYLQSYLIPTSIMSGLAVTNFQEKQVNLVYQIIDEAYHVITVNQYILDNVTRHKTENHSLTTEDYELKIYYRTEQVEVPCEDPEATEACYDTVTHYGYLKSDLEEHEDKAKNMYTNANDEAIRIENTSLNSSYPDYAYDKEIRYAIVEAQTLNKFNTLQYEQECYSMTDVNNFENSDGGRIEVQALEFTKNNIPSKYEEITTREMREYDWHHHDTINVDITYGEEKTFRYFWQDKLTKGEEVSRNYTVDDVIAFVNTGDVNVAENFEPKIKLSGDEYDYYYKLQQEEKLNRIDIMNATPQLTDEDGQVDLVFNDYLSEGEAYSDYIGISRMAADDAFRLLDRYINESKLQYGSSISEVARTRLGNVIGEVIGVNFVWPLADSPTSVITSCAGYREISISRGVHGAMDVAGLDRGHEIYASQSGTVYKNGWDPNGYGNYIVIKHDFDPNYTYYTVYAHMYARSSLVVGDEIKVRDLIGGVGTTGNSTGLHLHFEIRQVAKGAGWKDNPVRLEPILYIQRDTISQSVFEGDLPDNCQDITSGNFGQFAAVGGSNNIFPDGLGANEIIQNINAKIDQMTDKEIIARLIYAEQGIGSHESKVLVGLSVLNSGLSVKETAKATYDIKDSNTGAVINKHYKYNCIASYLMTNVEYGNFWDSIPSEYYDIAQEAIDAKKRGTYKVQDDLTGETVECISIIMFQATTSNKPTPQSLPEQWPNTSAYKRITLKNNASYAWGDSYTAYYW